MKLGEELQNARIEKGLCIEELSQEVNLSAGTLRAYEQSRRIPSSKTLKLLDETLGLYRNWVSTHQYNDNRGEIHTLAPTQGGRARPNEIRVTQKKLQASIDVNEIRVEVIKKILEADPESLYLVYHVLSLKDIRHD